MVTGAPAITPINEGVPIMVAAVVASYTLLAADKPDTVNGAGVMDNFPLVIVML